MWPMITSHRQTQETTMRKRRYIVAALLILVLGKSASAQKQASAPSPADNKTVSEVLDFWISDMEHLVIATAGAMPEADYSFAPTKGEFKGVRTFAEEVKHLAAANYQLGAGALGEDPPAGTQDESASFRPDKSGNHGVPKRIVLRASSSCRRDEREKYG
jgi:hypothetical protein